MGKDEPSEHKGGGKKSTPQTKQTQKTSMPKQATKAHPTIQATLQTLLSSYSCNYQSHTQ